MATRDEPREPREPSSGPVPVGRVAARALASLKGTISVSTDGRPIPATPETCPRCGAEIRPDVHGWLDDAAMGLGESSRLVPCPVCSPPVLALRMARRINRAGIGAIPAYAAGWDWASLIERGGDAAAIDAVQVFTSMAVRAAMGGAADHDAAQGGPGQKRGLYLHGNLGRGKTSMAVCSMRDCMAAGLAGAFISTIDFFDSLREAYRANEGAQATELMRLAHTVAVLVLDDLGAEKPTGWVLQETYRLLEKRFATPGLYTIITGNFDMDTLQDFWLGEDAPMADQWNVSRVVQRLGRHCTLVHCAGANLSLKPRAPRPEGEQR